MPGVTFARGPQETTAPDDCLDSNREQFRICSSRVTASVHGMRSNQALLRLRCTNISACSEFPYSCHVLVLPQEIDTQYSSQSVALVLLLTASDETFKMIGGIIVRYEDRPYFGWAGVVE
jgi:hypothetical protein